MKYTLYQIRRQLWVNKKLYGVLALEFAVGVAIFVSCLSLMYTNIDLLEDHRKQMAEEPMIVYHAWLTGETETEPEMAVRYGDYLKLEEQFSDSMELYYAACYRGSGLYFLYEKVNEGNPIYFIFMNDAMFENTFSFKRENNIFYAGSRAYDFLTDTEDSQNYHRVCWGAKEDVNIDEYRTDMVNAVCFNFRMEDGKIQLDQNHGFLYTGIPEENTVQYIDRLSLTQYLDASQGLRMDIEDCVVGSVDMLEYLSEDYEPFDSILQIQYLENANDPGAAPELVNFLNQERGDSNFEFTLGNKILSMEKFSSETNQKIFYLMAMSIAIIGIVFVGTVGILLSMLHRRKKSMAVSYCCGSTPWRNFMELVGEVFSVFLFGGGLGLLLSAAIMPMIHAVQGRAEFYEVNIIYVILYSLIAAVLCCVIALAGVDNKTPANDLKAL